MVGAVLLTRLCSSCPSVAAVYADFTVSADADTPLLLQSAPVVRFELLSAGLDAPVLRLWDLRRCTLAASNTNGGNSPKQRALCEYRGHAPASTKPLKAITRPRWLVLPPGNDSNSRGSGSGSSACGPDALIAVQGEHTTKLTLYDASTGVVVSRGEVGGCATVLAPVSGFLGAAGGGGEGATALPCVAVAYEDGEIALLRPSHE